jgi:hypothetical protein
VVLILIAVATTPIAGAGARAHAAPAAARAIADTLSVGALPSRPTDLNDALGWANYERGFGENLPPVTTSAALSAPPQTHANWLAAFHAAGDPYCAHVQDPTHTWPAGEDHSHNVLFCGPTSIGAAIQGWVDTPYHGAGFVDPTVGAIGFGFALDTSTALFDYGSAPAALSRWPKPDGVLPSPAMISGESPDPRAACGYSSVPIGRPIFLTLPAAASFVAASVVGPTGAVKTCALHASPFETGAPTLDAGETTRQVAVLAAEPYTVGETYTASITMGSDTYTWSFLVGDAPAAPAVSAQSSGPGQATVSWAPADGHGVPIATYDVTNKTTGDHTVVSGEQTAAVFDGLTPGATYQFGVTASNELGSSAATDVAFTVPPVRLFHGLPLPERVLDTRTAGGPMAAGATRAVQVVGVTGAAPAAVAAISINLTAADPSGPGYLTAWPCDRPLPTASSLNYRSGEHAVPNHVIVPVATDGTICVTAGVNATAVVVDVDGWFARTSGLTPASPHRELDTRTAGGPKTDVAVGVAPPGAQAAIVNITAAGGSTAPGYVTAYPCGGSPPLVSNVNFAAGQIVANAAVAPVAADGSLCLHASVATDLLVDVAGYVTDNFITVGPTRVLDTRPTTGPTADATVGAVPAGARGAVLNVTAAGGSVVPGYVTVYPADGPRPPTSNLNFGADEVVPNAVVVRPDDGGRIHLAASTPVQFVVDVFGYFR